jgi:hypothetical protein
MIIKSNIEFKEMGKPGDIYPYEMIKNKQNLVFLKVIWRKRDYQFELVKIK